MFDDYTARKAPFQMYTLHYSLMGLYTYISLDYPTVMGQMRWNGGVTFSLLDTRELSKKKKIKKKNSNVFFFKKLRLNASRTAPLTTAEIKGKGEIIMIIIYNTGRL